MLEFLKSVAICVLIPWGTGLGLGFVGAALAAFAAGEVSVGIVFSHLGAGLFDVAQLFDRRLFDDEA